MDCDSDVREEMPATHAAGAIVSIHYAFSMIPTFTFLMSLSCLELLSSSRVCLGFETCSNTTASLHMHFLGS